MHKAHLFFPENDLALGRNLENYTAPGAATALRTSGYTLPMWFMDPGDCFIAQGVDARWLDLMRSRFGMEARVYGRNASGWEPRPWGWSRAARRFLQHMGFGRDTLPTDFALDRIRLLSHRRSAAEIAVRLHEAGLTATPGAQECGSLAAVEEYIAREGNAVVKLPWSSTGRGIVMTDSTTFSHQRDQIAGMIANQGSVMCEPRLEGILDLAMLFTMEEGHARYDGLSVFRNVPAGGYSGNILAPQPVLEDLCSRMLPDDSLDRVRIALPGILERLIGVDYQGPLGVDMMVYMRDGVPALDAAVELNLRNTMGHVTLRFYEKYCENGICGSLKVVGECPAESPSIRNNRFAGGTLCLNPPGGKFSFTAAAGGYLEEYLR